MDFPFSQIDLSENKKLRTFSGDVNSSELVWHMDEEDREVMVLESNSWYLQMDNELPVLLEQGKSYFIPKMTYHRVIKGENDLIIEISERKKRKKRKKSKRNRHHSAYGRSSKYFGSSFYDFGMLHGDSSGGDAGGDGGGGDGNRKKDPKVGTGKKPKGSGRRLYTDENPKDTVSVEFSSVAAIRKTLAKSSFKSKSHKRQSQIINLIHQRVRAAYKNAKDPKVKARLKKAFEYAEKRKEASKKKTIRLRKEKKK